MKNLKNTKTVKTIIKQLVKNIFLFSIALLLSTNYCNALIIIGGGVQSCWHNTANGNYYVTCGAMAETCVSIDIGAGTATINGTCFDYAINSPTPAGNLLPEQASENALAQIQSINNPKFSQFHNMAQVTADNVASTNVSQVTVIEKVPSFR